MIALISDIHGNYEALHEVLVKIDSLGIKDIYCLGDISGYYTQINECCKALRDNNVKCIIGNHDWYIISNSGCPRSKSANACINYQRGVISQENIDWLNCLPIHITVGELALVHGGWNNPLDEYLNASEEYFANFPNKYFASGHTHIQVIRTCGEKIYCNPGSVGQPRDGKCTAAFATFNGEHFELHRAEYDIDKVCQLMKDAGFNEYYYNRLKSGAPHFQI